MGNPFKKILQGLKYAGNTAVMLDAIGIPIPFVHFVKLGMTVAELTGDPGPDKLILAKNQALEAAEREGVDVSKIPSESIDVLVRLLLDQRVNTQELAFDVKTAAKFAEPDARVFMSIPQSVAVGERTAKKKAGIWQRMQPKPLMIKR